MGDHLLGGTKPNLLPAHGEMEPFSQLHNSRERESAMHRITKHASRMHHSLQPGPPPCTHCQLAEEEAVPGLTGTQAAPRPLQRHRRRRPECGTPRGWCRPETRGGAPLHHVEKRMSAWWQEESGKAGMGRAGTVAVQKEVGVVGWNGELHGQARVEESVNAALFIEVPWEGGAQNRVDAHKSRGRSGTRSSSAPPFSHLSPYPMVEAA